ncbi:MAG: PEP-CTERM sorting domain-containing protein [Chthoniobacterales bacterium]|nr:PEP-CTERM sorting domain-containing protein [Chthoniobacterales bacterium]
MKPLILFTALFATIATVTAAPDAADDYQSYGSLNYGDNGGTGLGALTYLEGSGGGVFLAGPGSAIDPAGNEKSMGIFAGGSGATGQAAYRSLNTLEVAGTYDVSARFNLSNTTAFSGFNIKTGVGSTFGTSELLAFGLNPAQGSGSISLFDATGTHTITLDGELRGSVIDFALTFDTSAGTYTLTASERGSIAGFFTGLLKDTNGAAAGVGSVADLGFANFNIGTNQDLIVDNISVSSLTPIPEPGSTAGILLLLAGFAWFKRASLSSVFAQRRTAPIR